MPRPGIDVVQDAVSGFVFIYLKLQTSEQMKSQRCLNVAVLQHFVSLTSSRAREVQSSEIMYNGFEPEHWIYNSGTLLCQTTDNN